MTEPNDKSIRARWERGNLVDADAAMLALEEVDRLERELAEVTEERTALAKAYIAERDALLKYKAQALIATSAIEPSAAQWVRDHAPDCGDNSCMFGGQGKGGMRTNGGCRCFRDLPTMKRIFVERMFAALKNTAAQASLHTGIHSGPDLVPASAVSSEDCPRCGATILTEAAPSANRALKDEKDEAYRQRNVLVAALARLFPAGTRRTNIEGWSEDWHGCVYIDLPSGQISYHYHDSQAHLFAGLQPYVKEWDGHDKATVEARLLAVPSSIEPSRLKEIADELERIPVSETGGTLQAVFFGLRPALRDELVEALRSVATSASEPRNYEAKIRVHNAEMESECAAMKCAYRDGEKLVYGRRCPHCPVHHRIDIDIDGAIERTANNGV